MSSKEKLRELLKTVPEVKEWMESLEFWCEIKYVLSDWSTDVWRYCFQLWLKVFLTDSGLEVENSNILEKIWLPLQERFIRMFCEKRRVPFFIIRSGEISFNRNESSYIKIDNTKDFDNQSEEVYQKIYEVLYNLKN